MRTKRLEKKHRRAVQGLGGYSRGRNGTSAGWTLVELLVVIAIVAVLAAIVMAVVNRSLAAARAATCVNNLKQLGSALIQRAEEHNNKLIPLQPSANPDTGKRPPIWPVQLALEGYLTDWNGVGPAPCGTGVWTCPDCDFMSNAYGGYGVVEDAIFVYEENTPFGSNQTGSLRLHKIASPSRTWLVGDACQKADKVNKGWYAIWSQPDRWNTHGPAERHNGKCNVCLVDGSVVRLTRKEIEERGLTENVVDE